MEYEDIVKYCQECEEKSSRIRKMIAERNMQSIENLSIELLEKNPEEYLSLLEELSKNKDPLFKETLQEKLNEKPYDSWYANHAYSLSFLVGIMNQDALKQKRRGPYFGCCIPNGINTELAIKILRKIVSCGGDINCDYYDGPLLINYFQTAKECTYFWRHAPSKYIDVLNQMFPIEEGIPPE